MIVKPAFSLLKFNYRRHGTHTCSMHFPNTCAIRMSEALVKTNKEFLDAFKKSGKNVCPHGYIRGAQDLAAVLAKAFGTRTHGWNAQPAYNSAPANAKGLEGIVCYMNIPSYPEGQGHIDLWEGDGPVGDEYWNAKTIWMWELT